MDPEFQNKTGCLSLSFLSLFEGRISIFPSNFSHYLSLVTLFKSDFTPTLLVQFLLRENQLVSNSECQSLSPFEG